MAKKHGQPIHGWVNLDKPVGISSAKVVGRVRRVFNAAKAGHAGTVPRRGGASDATVPPAPPAAGAPV